MRDYASRRHQPRISLRSIRATRYNRHNMTKNADHERTFAVVLEPEDEGGFTVRVPAFSEIVTYGNDEREALVMADDAIRLVIEDSRARGESLP
jgi:antitoxin HicB